MENPQNINGESAGPPINQPCGECGKETAVERPQQQSHLLNLPNELLLEVVSHVTDRHSLKSLISTCSDLLHLGLPAYQSHYRDHSWLFIKAALTGDVPLLDICAAHHAVPQNIVLFSESTYWDDLEDEDSEDDDSEGDSLDKMDCDDDNSEGDNSEGDNLEGDNLDKMDCDDDKSVSSAGEPNSSIPDEYDCSTVPAKVLERFSLGLISFEAAYTTLVWLFNRAFDASLGSMIALDSTAHPRHPDHDRVVYPIFGLPRTTMLVDLDELEQVMHHQKLDPSQYITTKDAHHCQCSSQTKKLPISATPKPTMDDLNKEVPCYGQIDCYRARPKPALRFLSWLDFQDATTLMNQCWTILLDNPTNEKIYQAFQFIQLLRRFGEIIYPEGSVYQYHYMIDGTDEDFRYNALTATFCAHCPSSLLEMVLTDFKNKLIHDRGNEDWKSRMAGGLNDRISEFFCRQILLQVLQFLDGRQGMILSKEGPSQNWAPSHPYEPLEMLVEKIKILRRWAFPPMMGWLVVLEQGITILEEAYVKINSSGFDEGVFERCKEALSLLGKPEEDLWEVDALMLKWWKPRWKWY